MWPWFIWPFSYQWTQAHILEQKPYTHTCMYDCTKWHKTHTWYGRGPCYSSSYGMDCEWMSFHVASCNWRRPSWLILLPSFLQWNGNLSTHNPYQHTHVCMLKHILYTEMVHIHTYVHLPVTHMHIYYRATLCSFHIGSITWQHWREISPASYTVSTHS